MNVLYFIIPLALLLGLFFVISFLYAAYKGQFDELETHANKILIDESTLQRKDNEQSRY